MARFGSRLEAIRDVSDWSQRAVMSAAESAELNMAKSSMRMSGSCCAVQTTGSVPVRRLVL